MMTELYRCVRFFDCEERKLLMEFNHDFIAKFEVSTDFIVMPFSDFGLTIKMNWTGHD